MRLPLTDTHRHLVARVLNVVTALCGIGALVLLAIVIGWPLGEAGQVYVRATSTALLTTFVVQEALRMLMQTHFARFFRDRYLEVILATIAGLELVFGKLILAWIGDRAPELAASTVTLFYLAGTQVTLVVLIALRGLRQNRFLSGTGLSPGLVFILSFALLITLGTLLLKTPQATPEEGISWVDALFTATSAVCVTGLTAVDTATAFTTHGHWMLLLLFQVGGLGVMTITYFFAYFFAGGVSLRNRIALQDLLSEENLGNIGTVLGLIVGFTLTTEIVGALVIHAALSGEPNAPADLAFFSLFHAVSAFCNAGFSTLSAGAADGALRGQAGFLWTIMALIVLGGLGFPVVMNFWDVSIATIRRRLGLRVAMPPRLTANSRIVIATTLMLLLGGAAAVYCTEFVFGSGEAPAGRMVTALFYSVTARSAGFHISPMGGLTAATMAVVMLLMFVGGSPSSTAGGIKTSTLAVAVLSLRRILTGRPDLEVFGRRLPQHIAERALAIVLLSLAFVVLVTTMLSALHPELPPMDLAFEAVSAIGTVGLSRGVTSQLGDPAKLVLVAAMFVGRVGVLLFLTSLIPRRPAAGYRYPETAIVIT